MPKTFRPWNPEQTTLLPPSHLVERSIVLFERLGGLDERDQLLFKDIVRSNVLTASSGMLSGTPTDEKLTLGNAWPEVFQQVLPRSQFCAAGKLVARAYREEFGKNLLAANSLWMGPRTRSRAIAAPG